MFLAIALIFNSFSLDFPLIKFSISIMFLLVGCAIVFFRKTANPNNSVLLLCDQNKLLLYRKCVIHNFLCSRGFFADTS